jgi:hypothetical protein
MLMTLGTAPGAGWEELTSFGPAMLTNSGNAQFDVQKRRSQEIVACEEGWKGWIDGVVWKPV